MLLPLALLHVAEQNLASEAHNTKSDATTIGA